MKARHERFGRASLSRRLLEGAAAGVIFAALSLALHFSGALDGLEYRLWDLRVRAFARPSVQTERIRLVMLDQGSLDWGARENGLGWPWPREVYAPIVDFLVRGGAKSIAFDVLYTEPSIYGVEDDEVLGRSAEASGRFIAAIALSSAQGGESWPAEIPEPGLRLSGSLPPGAVFPRGVFPTGEIAGGAAMTASVLASPDSDGVNRRIGLFSVFDGRIVPSLGLAAYCLERGIRDLRLEKNRLTAGSVSIPLDNRGRAILRYRGPTQTHAAVNAAAVIQSELQIRSGEKPVLDPEMFRDTHVIFGFTALGLLDLRPAPMSPVYPGMEIHATALDNLLAGDFIAPVPAPAAALITVLLALAAGMFVRLCRSAFSSALVFLAFMFIPAALGWGLYPAGYWMPVLAPFAAVVPTLLAGLTANYAGEGLQKKFIKSAFSQYLSPIVIDQLVHNPEKLSLGGEKKTLSILFSDIQGFTSISEKLDPVALTTLLNEYLTEVTGIIYEHGGTIDKYEGDAVIAFWNAPLDLPDHAGQAVRSALAYQKRLAEMRPAFRAVCGGDLFARIGINTGDVVIGNMGSSQRFNYTFLGDAGNLASRLEGINKQFGSSIMISQATRDAAGDPSDIVYREISRVTVVGKKVPVTVYEPMYRTDWESGEEVFETYDRALRLYYAGDFRQSLTLLEPLSARDAPAAAYIRRLGNLIASPPAEWNGVWDVTEK